jgi:putative transposase
VARTALGHGELCAIPDSEPDRQFRADGPKQNWVADLTYIWTAEGWLYVAVGLDLQSRRAVDWLAQARTISQLVADALMMAVWRRA